ncbi:MAG: histidine kinase [Candidatus Limnocylindrales bacterium]
MSHRAGLVLAVGAAAFAAFTTFVGAQYGAPPDFLALDLIQGLSFVVAGAAAVWLRPASPAGPLLLVGAIAWFAGSYAPTGEPALTFLGFAFERYYDVALAALLLVLSSPRQRFEPRWLIALLGVAFALRSFGRLFIALSCDECGFVNPFAVWVDDAAFTNVEVASNVAIAILLVVTGVTVLLRLARAGPVLRRARWMIFAAGALALTAGTFDALEYAVSTATGTLLLELDEPWAFVLEWGMFGARALVPLAVLLATLQIRRAPGPLGRLAAGLDRPVSAGTMSDSLRIALGDPSLRLLRPVGDGTWAAEDSTEVSLPGAGTTRTVTFVDGADAPLAAIEHDMALLDHPELLDGVVRVLRLALQNERLEGELREQLEAVTASRARIVTAAEEERRRLERDLHDGAQQRLIGVTLAIQQARAAAGNAPDAAAVSAQLDRAADETNHAIRELRELARGVHPAILQEEGLAAAVAGLARRAAIPVETIIELDGRLPQLIESTAYFLIAEALTNTQRHARAASGFVHVARDGDLVVVEIRDDGAGGADIERGSGLRGLVDRVAAINGTLVVVSPPGGGTSVRAEIPVP